MLLAQRAHKQPSPHCIFNRRTVALFMLPGVMMFVIFRLIPSLSTVMFSFTDISGLLTDQVRFIGLDNYKEFFILQNKRDLYDTLIRTGIYALVVTLVQNGIALMMAVILNQKFIRGRNLYRGVYFLPAILGVTVVSVVWKLIFSSPSGPVYLFMKDAMGIANPPVVLSSYEYAFPAVMAAQIWMYMGNSMIIFLAGLQNVPEELYESAAIDGSNAPKSFRYITLPLIWPSVTINVLLSIIGALGSYDLIVTITAGEFNTKTLGFSIYDTAFGASASMRQGYASAQSMVLFVIVLIASLITQAVMKRMERD